MLMHFSSSTLIRVLYTWKLLCGVTPDFVYGLLFFIFFIFFKSHLLEHFATDVNLSSDAICDLDKSDVKRGVTGSLEGGVGRE